MQVRVTHDGEEFRLTSHGNGLAYLLVRKGEVENREVFLQGDDAVAFDKEVREAEDAWPDATTEEVLESLWANGYADLAD